MEALALVAAASRPRPFAVGCHDDLDVGGRVQSWRRGWLRPSAGNIRLPFGGHHEARVGCIRGGDGSCWNGVAQETVTSGSNFSSVEDEHKRRTRLRLLLKRRLAEMQDLSGPTTIISQAPSQPPSTPEAEGRCAAGGLTVNGQRGLEGGAVMTAATVRDQERQRRALHPEIPLFGTTFRRVEGRRRMVWLHLDGLRNVRRNSGNHRPCHAPVEDSDRGREGAGSSSLERVTAPRFFWLPTRSRSEERLGGSASGGKFSSVAEGSGGYCMGRAGESPCGACRGCVSLDMVVRNALRRRYPEDATAAAMHSTEGVPRKLFRGLAGTARRLTTLLPSEIRGAVSGHLLGFDEDKGNASDDDDDGEARKRRKFAESVWRWKRFLRNGQSLGKWSMGNEVAIFDNNEETFADMWRAIDAAEQRVWLETYIFDDSAVAKETAARLAAAAERGCDVILIADYIGSLGVKSSVLKDLEAKGVTCIIFNAPAMTATKFPLPPSFSKSSSTLAVGGLRYCVGPLAFRDHRKILVADDIGHLGSVNISEDDADPPYGNGKYYGTQLRIKGPAVSDLARVFIDSLSEATRSTVTRPVPPRTRPIPDGVYVQILESNVRRGVRNIQRVLEHVVRSAQDSVIVTQSYFIPAGFLRRALTSAMLRGVRVSALISGASDVIGDFHATLYVLHRFLAGPLAKAPNAAVNFLLSRHCHAKCTVVDGIWSSIGSFNWDRYSARRNLEVVATIFDFGTATELESLHFDLVGSKGDSRRFSAGTETTEAWPAVSRIQRVLSWLAYWTLKGSSKQFWDGFEDYQQKHRQENGATGKSKTQMKSLREKDSLTEELSEDLPVT